MKHSYILLVIIIILASASSVLAQSQIATIKKKNGKVIEGTISGLIIQKGKVEKSTENSKIEFTVSYYLTNGNEIESINEEGVTRVSDKVVSAVVTEKGVPPNDNVALKGIVDMPSEAMFGSTKTGGTIILIAGRSKELRGTNAETLLGEFRSVTGGGKLIPAIKIMTANGTITIPIKEIVAFKKKTVPAEKKP